MAPYDPDAVGCANGNLFSLPHRYEEAAIVVLPVPWDVTTSYGDGTSRGPEAILKASAQLDLSDPYFHQSIWEYGVYMIPRDPAWLEKNDRLRQLARNCISWQEQYPGQAYPEREAAMLREVNLGSEQLHHSTREEVEKALSDGKLVGLIGGEHSIAYGLLQAIDAKGSEFGILQIDAHADLRNAYEGFRFSHASIFHNALQLSSVIRLTQVGLRDYAPGEWRVIQTDGRIQAFTSASLREQQFRGKSWHELCNEIVSTLPDQVYVSFDIDGLSPDLCPNTGTPVPGGLSFSEALYLLQQLAHSGKRIVGFDLSEVAPGKAEDEWDGNVGARMLFHLCNAMRASQCQGSGALRLHLAIRYFP